MDKSRLSPPPITNPHVSIGRGFWLLEYAINANSRLHFFSPDVRKDAARTPDDEGWKRLCIRDDYHFLQKRIIQFLDMLPKEDPRYEDMIFLRDKTRQLFNVFFTPYVSLDSIFEDDDEKDRYLRLMQDYIYENHSQRFLEISMQLPNFANQLMEQTEKKANQILFAK